LNDKAECEMYGTDPTNWDTDGDGLPDDVEVDAGTDPLVQDTDADGLTDFYEINVHGTDPLNEDTDGDDFFDRDEVNSIAWPDGNDYEIDPTLADTDGDGENDNWEYYFSTDPTSASSVPGTGVVPSEFYVYEDWVSQQP